jgi:hypothetical protein
MRLHGFERPYDSHQVASWVAYVYLLACFFVLYTPLHTDALGVALSCVYALAAAWIAVVAYRCTKMDPSDPGVLAKRTGAANVAAGAAAGSAQNFCVFCEAHVNQRSKHCRQCAAPPAPAPRAARAARPAETRRCRSQVQQVRGRL